MFFKNETLDSKNNVKQQLKHFAYPIVFILVLSVSGCSSPRVYRNPKMGLLDYLSAFESARKRPSRRNTTSRHFSTKTLTQLRNITKKWRWPLKYVRINSRFGRRGKKTHEGLDLNAKSGTEVFAVSGGQVVYSGNGLSGYGNLIIVRHEAGLFSVYAHLSNRKVSKGDKIMMGQFLGQSGKTGRVTGPHLHFEIRRGTVALDPASLMPGISSRTVAKSD